MSNALTRNVSPGETRLVATKRLAEAPGDPLAWLEAQRDFAAADREEAFSANDNVSANRHHDLVMAYATAAEELGRLRKLNDIQNEVLRNRIIIAMAQAEAPSWRPTHRHYKGGLYRATGRRASAEHDEPIEGIEYDDAEGSRWWMPRHRWESITGAGRPRYAALLPDDPALVE